MKQFVATLDTIANSNKKATKQSTLLEYLRTLNAEDRIVVCRILLNEKITGVGTQLFKKFRNNQATLDFTPITLQELWNSITALNKSPIHNTEVISRLMSRCTPLMKTYLVKIMLNNLSIGMSDNLVLDVIGQLTNNPEIRTHYFTCNDIELILRNNYHGIKPFQTIRPMLAKAKLQIEGDTMSELKMDGFRALFHLNNGEWRLYSRRCEDISDKIPYIGEQLHELCKHANATITSIILDMELITDSMRGQDAMNLSNNLHPVIFDILYINEVSVIDCPYYMRREELEVLFPEEMLSKKFTDPEVAFEYAMTNGYEGIITKGLNDPYYPHERKWLKVKRNVDTIDLAITGYTFGTGKREGKIGALICSIWFEGNLTEFCKCGSGLNDYDLEMFTKLLSNDIIETSSECVIVNPKHCVEIEFFEVSDSPSYKTGKSARFPIYKQLRSDKNISDVTRFEDLDI